MKPRFLAVPLLVPVLLAPPAGAEPDFRKDVKPILEARCVKCHGPSKMEGELDLSTKEGALIGGEYGSAIVEGEVEESILMQRITLPKDHEEVMPSKGKPLKKEEIEKIAAWITAGAAWPEEIVLEERKEAKKPKAGGAAEGGKKDGAKGGE